MHKHNPEPAAETAEPVLQPAWRSNLPKALTAAALSLNTNPLQASPLLSVTGDIDSAAMIANTTVSQSVITASWRFTADFRNVSISAMLGHYLDEPVTGRAWLTREIGPNADAADVVAFSTFSIPFTDQSLTDPPPSWVTLFSGLDLAADDYYLTLGSSSGTAGWFLDDQGATISEMPGVDLLSYYFSASPLDFDLLSPYRSQFLNSGIQPFLRIDGEPVSARVPEPASLALLVLSLPLLARRKQLC